MDLTLAGSGLVEKYFYYDLNDCISSVMTETEISFCLIWRSRLQQWLPHAWDAMNKDFDAVLTQGTEMI